MLCKQLMKNELLEWKCLYVFLPFRVVQCYENIQIVMKLKWLKSKLFNIWTNHNTAMALG